MFGSVQSMSASLMPLPLVCLGLRSEAKAVFGVGFVEKPRGVSGLLFRLFPVVDLLKLVLMSYSVLFRRAFAEPRGLSPVSLSSSLPP